MGKFYQFQTAAACSFGSFIMGLLNVWPSYTASLYTSANTTLLTVPMTDMESSLLGSLPSLGAMVGSAVVGILINTFGRRNGGLLITLPYVMSWVLIQVSSTSLLILVARFLGGMAGGAYLAFAPIFISEIAEDSIRGTLASGPTAFYCFGALISYILGWLASYEIILWTNLLLSVGCALFIMLVAESPLYLLKQNREEDARASIAHYRGTSSSSKVVLDELSRLKQQIMPAIELIPVRTDPESFVEEAEKEKLNIGCDVPNEAKKMSSMKLLFVSPTSRRAFLVVATVGTLQVLMGIVPVQVYAKQLFAEAAPSISSHICSICFAVILVSGSFVTALVADKAGRRILLLTSAVMVAVCMTTLGFLIQTSIAPAWITAVIILVYCFFFIVGAGTIPYVLLTEAFIPEVQSLAAMLLLEWVWFLNFFILAVFPFMTKLIGIHGVFYIFAGMATADAIIGYFIVPETKGLSNAEIQEVFSRRRK